MNIVLSSLNAAALIALVTFHFQGSSNETEQVHAVAQPSHFTHEAAQVAVLHQQRGIQAMLTADSNEVAPTSIDRSERWVF
ncbi:hypothetical protein [Pseudomonas sp.]|uniref:hypothetical protein n=1 Tax=Pseudomonas sp. TaxID=306 RepID=UPI0026253E76|nr:hypothetical protein [Pseudomonas sp.]